jgi:hypothetical protein
MVTLQEPLNESQERAMLHLFDSFQTFGVGMEKLAHMTGIGQTALTNKFNALDALNQGKEPDSSDRFTTSEYDIIWTFASGLRRSMGVLPARR